MPANMGFLKNNIDMDRDHVLTRVERARYIYFTCPNAPKMELVSFDEPKQCPVCRTIKPVDMGTAIGKGGSYSDAPLAVDRTLT